MQVGDIFNPRKMFVGSFIPNCIMEIPNSILGSTDKLVWARLAQYAGADGKCWPLQETLGQKVGVSGEMVRQSLKRLEEQGFIRRIPPTGKDRLMHKPNHYIFLWHPVFEAVVEEGSEELGHGNKYVTGPQRQNTSGPTEEVQNTENKILNTVPEVKAQPQPEVQRSSRTLPVLPPDPPTKAEVKAARNKQMLPLANQLAEIIRSHKKINIKPSQIESWADDIRLLVDEDDVNPRRVKLALDWYSQHIGEEFVVVILSGSALRDKFLRLEGKMEGDRPAHSPSNPTSFSQNKDQYRNITSRRVSNE